MAVGWLIDWCPKLCMRHQTLVRNRILIVITALNGGATIINMMFTDYAMWVADVFHYRWLLGYHGSGKPEDRPIYTAFRG